MKILSYIQCQIQHSQLIHHPGLEDKHVFSFFFYIRMFQKVEKLFFWENLFFILRCENKRWVPNPFFKQALLKKGYFNQNGIVTAMLSYPFLFSLFYKAYLTPRKSFSTSSKKVFSGKKKWSNKKKRNVFLHTGLCCSGHGRRESGKIQQFVRKLPFCALWYRDWERFG